MPGDERSPHHADEEERDDAEVLKQAEKLGHLL
jgi:hypothetical protein